MDPYLATGLAMCAIILISIAGTSYLAVFFTRRAKADVARLLNPLAALLEDGSANVDDAEVTGRYEGALVFGRMARAAAGTVTIWQTDVIDSAGGESWNFVYSRANPRKPVTDAEIDIVTDAPVLRTWLQSWTVEMIAPIAPLEHDWVQVEYSAESGIVRVAHPIRNRNQIPPPADFQRDLTFAIHIGDQNRSRQQGASDAE